MSREAEPSDQISQQLAQRLERVIPQYGSVVRRVLSELEGENRLTIPQFRALQAISHRGDAGALNLELARQIGVAAPSMTAMIDGLVDRGLVHRSIDPGNRRQVNIVLTPRGHERYRTISSAIEARLAEGLASLDARDQESLLSAIERLEAVLRRLGQLDPRDIG